MSISKIEIWERITREDVRQNKDKIFLFGDNLIGRGLGGQAKEMRGEENSRGIPTKKEPNNRPASFFTDKEFTANKKAIDEAFGKIPNDKTLVIPRARFGTGLAQLSEKAPQTFAYLNEKLAEIGFDNSHGKSVTNTKNTDQTNLTAGNQDKLLEDHGNRVIIQSTAEKTVTAKRVLDLNNIQTANLRLLSLTENEIEALKIDRKSALTDYADRLRGNYKTNNENLRDGFKILSDSIDRHEQITVTCSCRNGEMCHADVVKMAVEKVNLHIKTKQVQEADRLLQNNEQTSFQKEKKTNSQIREVKINPRTQRAINEILAVSDHDRALEKLGQTEGRNRSEQASYLGKTSQLIRDIYERGAIVSGGNLIIPQENLGVTQPLAITTQDYAVSRIGKIFSDESKAKEIAPSIVEYGNKIAGTTADGETKLKVFNWIYESLEGKTDFLGKEDDNQHSKSQNFENTLEKIRFLSEEMYSLEPTDKLEFVPLVGFEQSEQHEPALNRTDENLNLEVIYETAITREESEKQESLSNEHLGNEQIYELESETKINSERFERIELSGNVPQIPEEFTEREINRLLTKILPDIDRQLESGASQKEILRPFNEIVWQSKQDDALNRLEKIYQKQRITELDTKISDLTITAEQKEKLESEKSRVRAAVLTPTREELREILLELQENSNLNQNKSAHIAKAQTIAQLGGQTEKLSQSINTQLGNIDLRRHNVIEIKNPGEYRMAEETAISTFFQKSKQEIGRLLEKLDEIRQNPEKSVDKQHENSLKKELNQIKDSKPSFAFKLENSSKIVVGEPSVKAIGERNFVSSYVNFQLKQPESRLRFESERYRIYAARLEAASNRNEVIKAAGEIRTENAAIGFKWKDLKKSEKESQPRPLSNKEMQFLFTETSPTHYTSEMTATRLSFAHSGASRRQMTESLIKGEINASPEAGKLIDSLQSRLERRDLENAISATKHFFESLKTPNEQLKYKNDFDHREVYRKLPPQEKDFVYYRATRQKENLEYKIVYSQQQLIKAGEISRNEIPKTEPSKTEKSFHLISQYNQARILGEKIESSSYAQKEISERDASAALVLLKNQTPEKIELIARELRQRENPENKKIGEVLDTFGRAEISTGDNKTIVNITLPENGLVELETYRELLEKFYPDEERENNKYKLASFGENTLSRAREKGQDETIKNCREETRSNVYQNNVSANVFSTEQVIVEKFDKIKQFQQEARNARFENMQMLEKYARRAAAKLQSQKLSIPAQNEQKEFVSIALGGKDDNSVSNRTNNQFFQAVQNDMPISDFQRFAANEKILSEIKANIKNEFTEISRAANVLEESKFKTSSLINKDEKLHQIYQNLSQTEENRLLTDSARQAFAAGAEFGGKNIGDLVEKSEKETIKLESLTKARIALEPELKSSEQIEYNEQALKFGDKLEKAHELSKQEAPTVEIQKAFESAEREKLSLSELGGRTQIEDKPVSLLLYEKELDKSEKQLWAKSLSDKLFDSKDFLATKKPLNLETLFSPQEREQIKLEAARIARERLEPKELDADHRKVSNEVGTQALTTFKQLEHATDIFQASGDNSKIHESFSKLDHEAGRLNQIRKEYNRTEKLALLRGGIKSDIADFLRKNPDVKGSGFAQQTSEILTKNLEKTGAFSISGDNRQIITLSREISEKLEAKRNTFGKDKTGFDYSESKNISNQGQQKSFQSIGENLPQKSIKNKEAPIFTR